VVRPLRTAFALADIERVEWASGSRAYIDKSGSVIGYVPQQLRLSRVSCAVTRAYPLARNGTPTTGAVGSQPRSSFSIW